MVAITDSVGELAGVVRSMFGLTRHNRLRDQLRDTIALYQLAAASENLEQSTSNLRQVVDLQTARLLAITSQNRRKWAWGGSILALVIAGVFAIPGVYLLREPSSWWVVVLLTVDALVVFTFVVASVGVLVQRPSDDT